MRDRYIEDFKSDIKSKSDRLMNYFLPGFFILGLLFAFYYETWMIALAIGSLSLVAYYSAKIFLPHSDLYQYVLSAVIGIFMAQYIYQMHGLFEMHFFAFIGSTILVTYRKWQLQIPIAIVVFIHHAGFGYLQFIGVEEIHFTQLDYMSLQTFIIHILLALGIFSLCGLWSYRFKVSGEQQVEQSFQLQQILKERHYHITSAVISAQEKERMFLGQELHDNINPLLATVQLYMDCGILNVDQRASLLKESKILINTAVEEIRTISNSLIPKPFHQISLKESIADICKNINKASDLQFIADWDDLDENALSDNVKLTIFRIVQEQITNIIKHAYAREVIIEIYQDKASLVLNIKDDGIGFDVSSKRNGVGLQNIDSRAELLDGQVIINSSPGNGCELKVIFDADKLLVRSKRA